MKEQLEEEPERIEAKTIWADTDENVIQSLKLNNREIFTFNATGLTSDILPRENVQGIRNFCLRMACTISKNSSVRKGVVLKYSILIFPDSKGNMLSTYKLAQSLAWPGMRVIELVVLPRPPAKWGCPILPLIMPGTPFELKKSFLDYIYRYKLLLSHVLSQRQGFPFLLAKKMQPEPEPP